MIQVSELDSYLQQTLNFPPKQDYCPNGMQVGGTLEIKKVLTAVTASEAAIDAAIEWNADLLLVHHGLFWKSDEFRIVGMKKMRLKKIFAADLNIMAWHLPLDSHPVYGNNAQLGAKLGIRSLGTLLGDTTVMLGELESPMEAAEFALHLEKTLLRKPLHIGNSPRKIKRVGWSSGGAQKRLEQIALAGCDAYFTGEVSEECYHVALEYGVHFFAAGHHATEQYGVQALGTHLAEKFSLEHKYFDLANPV